MRELRRTEAMSLSRYKGGQRMWFTEVREGS